MTSRSPIQTQRRIAYINIETPNKDPSTIFHSPYKNGKKNKDYSNPTLTSSNIFYDKKMIIENKFAQLDNYGKPKSPQKDYSYNYQENMNDEKSYIRNRSITPESNLSLKNSKTPRRKRQFDQTKEYIKDHFTSGLAIPAQNKRRLKKYLNSNSKLDYIQQNQDQSETIKHYLGKIEDRSLYKSTSQLNFNNTSYVNPVDEQNKSTILQNGQIPTQMQNYNSFILNSKKNQEDKLSQLSQTHSTERPFNQQQQQVTPKNKRNIDFNDKEKEQRNLTLTTQELRYQTPNSSSQKRSLTPTTSQQRLRQQFTPLKECCDQCINKKIVQDKQQKIREEKERDQYNEQQINTQMNEEFSKQQKIIKEKQIQVKKQLDIYSKTKREEVQTKKMEQIQENMLQNKKLNDLIEHEKKIETETLKQQKLQKIKIYSQQLKEQIDQKEQQRKNQILKEKEEEQNLQLIKGQNDFQVKKTKYHQNMVDYRDQLYNQQIEQEMVKNQEKHQDKQMIKEIQEQIFKYSEQEKEIQRNAKIQRKQNYQDFMDLRQQVINQKKEEKKKSDQEIRQRFQEQENEDQQRKVSEKKIESLQKQKISNILKEQIQQRDNQDKLKKEQIKNSISSNLLLDNHYNLIQQKNLSPCQKCDKKVPKQQLAYFN